MIAMEIDFFQNKENKFYKILVKPNKDEEFRAVDMVHKEIQKLINENNNMHYNIYNCTENQFLTIVEFYM